MIIKLIRNCEAGNAGEIIEVSKAEGKMLIGRREGKLIEEVAEKKETKKSK